MPLPPYQYDPEFDVNTIPRDPRFDTTSLIGPHEGRELTLIKMGKKGVLTTAKSTKLYQEVQRYVKSGELVEMNAYNPKHSIFYRPQLKEDAQLVYFYQQKIAMADACKEKLALSGLSIEKWVRFLVIPKSQLTIGVMKNKFFALTIIDKLIIYNLSH